MRILSLLLATTGTLTATPALAQWETAHGYGLKTGERCPDPHDRKPALRRTDGRAFDIPAGFRGEIEIYGHGVDLIGSAAVDNRPWASRARGVGGAENAARGCGAIGSIVVRFDVPYDTPGGTHTLRFGDQTMRIRVTKPTILGAEWSPQTLQGRSLVAGGPAPAPARAITPAPLPGSTPGEGCGINGRNCSGSSSAQAPAATGGGTASPDDPPRLDDGIGSCLGDLGGTVVREPRTLTITFPLTRGDRFDLPCLIRPIFLNVLLGDVPSDVGGFRAGVQGQFHPDRGRAVDPPRYSGTLSGFTGPIVLADPNRDFQSLRMTADFARSFVGERQIRLTPPTGSGASELTLILRSDPGNGIRTIEVSSSRINSTIEVRFDYLAALAGEQRSFWRLRRTTGGPDPATCFTATAGSVASRATTPSFTLTAREAQGCTGARFALDIGPARGASGYFEAPYARTVEFTLAPLTAPEINRPTPRPTAPVPRN